MPKTLLTIDDDPQIRRLAHLILGNAGYQVHSAADGNEAFEVLRNIPRPAGILLDLMMPGMDGARFLEVRKDDPELAGIPVVICTAAREQLTASLEAAYPVLFKPFGMQEMLTVVAQYFGELNAS